MTRCNAKPIQYFNPRSRVGSDRRCCLHSFNQMQFQSTLPCRERLQKAIFKAAKHDFNPRSRVGSDNQVDAQAVSATYFNPRSRVGSDRHCWA